MIGHDDTNVCPLCDETAFCDAEELAEDIAMYRTRIEDETAAKIAEWVRTAPSNRLGRPLRAHIAAGIERGDWRGK